jgi:hypothetical protein
MIWKKALIVVIPKPGREDYAAVKNYQPISLLECMGKLLKKAMSNHFLYNINKFQLIPTTQYGTRKLSCTLDVGLTLLHDVQHALCLKQKCGAIFSDIKGFFD